MKKTIFSAALLAAMFAGGFTQAATTSGKISSIDDDAKTVTLENGVTYDLSSAMYRQHKLGGYLPGDMVTIVWDKAGDKHMARAMSPDHASGITGKIKSVDEQAQTVTLENGTVYDFKNPGDEKFHLAGFRAGDEVVIHATRQGDKETGVSIASAKSDEVTGAVKSTDPDAMTLTLEDGTVYHFDQGSGVRVEGYRPGDKVTVTTYSLGDEHVASAISPAS